MKDVYELYTELENLRQEQEDDESIQWFFPAGALWSISYGEGYLGVIYHKPNMRKHGCVLSIVTIDDGDFTLHGKPNSEDAVISEVRQWDRGLPTLQEIQTWAQSIGLFVNI